MRRWGRGRLRKLKIKGKSRSAVQQGRELRSAVPKYRWTFFACSEVSVDSVLRNGLTYCCLLPTRSTGYAYIAFRTQAVHCIPCWTSTRAASTAYIGFRTPAVHCIPYSSSTLYSVLEQYIAFRTQAVLLVLATAIP